MADTLYNDIRSALTKQLADMPAVPAVAWDNFAFTPTTGTPYLKPTILWAESSQAELGEAGRNWEQGVYQITCIYPKNEGSKSMLAMAGKIKDRFKRGTVLTFNAVTVTIRKVYLGPESPGAPDRTQLPISIAFYCQAAN